MSEEIELAAKSTGAVVGAMLDASGITAPMQEITGGLASWLHPRLVASAAKQMMAAVEKLQQTGVRPGAVRDEQMRALLEEGAREEDEGLREKWANLLAHGLAGGLDGVPTAFGEVLRQLEPTEVQVLDAMAGANCTFSGALALAAMKITTANFSQQPSGSLPPSLPDHFASDVVVTMRPRPPR